MSEESTRWLSNAISDGLVEWFATRVSEGLPEPSEDERRAFRLGFTFGADAGIQLTCERLAVAEDEPLCCGCCGDDQGMIDANWCEKCIGHVLTTGQMYERTFLAQHRRECPFQL